MNGMEVKVQVLEAKVRERERSLAVVTRDDTFAAIGAEPQVTVGLALAAANTVLIDIRF